MTRWRRASSSAPSTSNCSSVRVILSVGMSCGGSSLSEGELDVAERGGDADLHVLLVGGRYGAGDQVAHGAAGLAARARVADAHPASVLGREAGGLGLLDQRAAGVGRVDFARGERDRAAGRC